MAITKSPTAPANLPAMQSPSTPQAPVLPPNVSNVVLGNLHMKPWYPSFYPEDIIGGRRTDWLYVCQWCFRYTGEIMKFAAHSKVCPLKHEAPPGALIYEKDGYAIYELDGEEHKLYAQNLSLFAKLFLETKSVFFDASTFLYYTLVLTDASTSRQVVGFFSKEKMSWDNNNVACILVFPPWQRRALGQILIAASYALGKREGRFGGPERPLSALGRKGYIAFWSAEVARYVLQSPLKKTVSVKELSDATYILPEDLVAALKEMEVFEKRKTPSGSLVVHKSKVKAWSEKFKVSPVPLVDEQAFVTPHIEGWDGDDDEVDEDAMEE